MNKNIANITTMGNYAVTEINEPQLYTNRWIKKHNGEQKKSKSQKKTEYEFIYTKFLKRQK